MNNMQQILASAKKLQVKMADAQKSLEKEEVTGTTGDGLVSVKMTLRGNVKSIHIDKKLVNPDEKDLLEDLILVALSDAKTKADKAYDDGMKAVTGGLAIPPEFGY